MCPSEPNKLKKRAKDDNARADSMSSAMTEREGRLADNTTERRRRGLRISLKLGSRGMAGRKLSRPR